MNNGNAGKLIKDARSYIQQGKYEEAIKAYTELIRENPFEGYLGRASVYHKMANYAEAISDYTQAIEIDKHRYDAYYFRGNAYYMANKLEEALSDINHSLQLNPSNPRARENRRFIMIRLGLGDPG
jgi:tetratricopeptide (TPR) repeat protein